MLCEKTHLFEARTGGYHVYRIPGLLVTRRGVALATTEARRGEGGDFDPSDLLLRRSADGGRTWEPARCLASYEDYGPGPMNNLALTSDARDGVVHAVFCHDYARVFYMCSDDDGASFSTPVEITAVAEELRRAYPWQVIAAGPGHGLQLRTGRILVTVWLSDGSGNDFGPGHRGHRPSCVSFLYSDDHGATWHAGPLVVPVDMVKNASETICEELSDGTLYFNVRNESEAHRRLVLTSPDGGETWSAPRFDEALLEPICMAGIIRHDWEPGCILFSNPDVLESNFTPDPTVCDRRRLTVKMSYDDCRTWPVSRVLEDGPSGYSDLAVLPDGTVLCLYECGLVTRMYDDKYLVVARFDLDWLTAREAIR